MDTSSCLVHRLSHYLDLTDKEVNLLEELEKTPIDVEAGSTLYHEGDKLTEVFIVKSGWLMSSTILLDGQRQILQLDFPGSLVGSTSIAFAEATVTAKTVTDVTLCRLPRSSLSDLFQDAPRLASLFYSIAMLENMELCDRLKTLGKTDARARIASFILSIFSRLRIIRGRDLMELEIPLRQLDIADAVGLTSIHVNRILKRLTEENLISRDGNKVRIENEDALSDICEFEERLDTIDTSWFPPAE